MKRNRPFYPVLFGIYPALALLAANISQIPLLYGVRSVLAALLFTLIVYGFLLWRVKDQQKAALLSFWITFLFFSYGHVYGVVEGFTLGSVVLGRHLVMMVIWGLLLLAGICFIFKKMQPGEGLRQILNGISVILVLLPLFQIGAFELTRRNVANIQRETTSTPGDVSSGNERQRPDVYYIILDAYTRDDMMLIYHQLDNSAFIHSLQDIGFYIPPCTQSNYGITAFSLASSLNMNYLDAIDPHSVAAEANWVVFGEPIRHSQVRRTFEDLGYQIVNFESGVWWDEITDADYFISRGRNPLDALTNFSQVSDFEVLFLRTTALRILEEASSAFLQPLLAHVGTPEEDHADRILFILDQLAEVPALPSPKFVFVHLVAPHSPYVFAADGTFVPGAEAMPGYADEVQYLNSRIIPLVQEIIQRSDVPPIIILQGDHGQDNENRMAILNAYFFPEGGSAVLYPTITPVNTFRLVFDTYLGQDLPLLPDISYFSNHDNVYEFHEMTHACDAERYSQ